MDSRAGAVLTVASPLLADRALVVRATELQPTRWRNGGGTTRELHVGPACDHGLAAWRLSLATIATDGPFSAFPGVDRSLLLLSSTSLRLDVDGRANGLGQYDRLEFPGEAAVVAGTDGRTSEVLNLMTCRACTRGTVLVREYDGMHSLSLPDPAALVLLGGTARHDSGALHPHDTVVLSPAPTQVVFRSARVAAVSLTTSGSPTAHPQKGDER